MQTLVRGFAVALVLAGFLATVKPNTHAYSAAAKSTVTSVVPVPVCPPNDPNACHIEQW